jgi:tetratricopeptide (TPR) repeat protein
MHELFRQYAEGKLDGTPDAGVVARDRHCALYTAALEQWGRELKGPGQVNALAEMGADIGNACAAWEWAAKRGYVERLGQGMDGLCRFYEWQGRYQEGEALVRESLAIRQALGDQRGIAMSRRSLGIIVCLQGRVEECERLLRQSLAAFQAVGDRVDTAGTLTNLSYVLLFLGKPAKAHAQLGKSAAILDELGLRDWVTAQNLSDRGLAALWLGRYQQARAFTEAGLAVARELGRHNILTTCLSNLGRVAIVEED